MSAIRTARVTCTLRATLGIALPYISQPWDLFANFFLQADGSFTIELPATVAGDQVILRTEMDAFVVVSACPQDPNATCGGQPTDLSLDIGRRA